MEYLDVIKDSNDRMIRLVNDLLSVNRIDQQRLEMRPQSFSIEDLIEKEIKQLIPIADGHNIQLQYKKPENLPQAYADQDKVQMVVQNLIDNAIKYSKKEGGLSKIDVGINRKKIV